MSILDLASKRMAMMSTLQNQFNAKNKYFLETTRTLEFYKVAEDSQEVGVDSCDKDPIYLER